MTKPKKKVAAVDPNVKKQVRMMPQDATKIIDKNSRTMTKIIELVALGQTDACKAVDEQRLIDRKIEILKMRLNRRLVKLSRWVDAPENERLPLPVYRHVPAIYLPKGPRALFATKGVPAHILMENAYHYQKQAGVRSSASNGSVNDMSVRPDLAATLQKRLRYNELQSDGIPSAIQTATATFSMDRIQHWNTGNGANGSDMQGLMPPAKVTILPGRKINKITGERVTSEEQELCECGTAYTYHNKSRHLKSHKHIEYVTQKERLLALQSVNIE